MYRILKLFTCNTKCLEVTVVVMNWITYKTCRNINNLYTSFRKAKKQICDFDVINVLYQWNIHFYLGLIEDQHPSIEVDDLTNGPKVKSNKNNLSLKIVKPLIWKSPWYLKPLPLPQVFQAGLVFRAWIFMRRNKWLFWLKHLPQVLQSSV